MAVTDSGTTGNPYAGNRVAVRRHNFIVAVRHRGPHAETFPDHGLCGSMRVSVLCFAWNHEAGNRNCAEGRGSDKVVGIKYLHIPGEMAGIALGLE